MCIYFIHSLHVQYEQTIIIILYQPNKGVGGWGEDPLQGSPPTLEDLDIFMIYLLLIILK